MNPVLTLVRSAWLDDWFVLEGGGNWASVEGTSAEWREIASTLRSGRGPGARFKRAAMSKESGDYWDFWSPRNATGLGDHVRVALKHGPVLADHIEAVLAAYTVAEKDEEDSR